VLELEMNLEENQTFESIKKLNDLYGVHAWLTKVGISFYIDE
jgi:hypothetical protein